MCRGCIKKTRRVAGGVIWCVMITRGDVQRVMDVCVINTDTKSSYPYGYERIGEEVELLLDF